MKGKFHFSPHFSQPFPPLRQSPALPPRVCVSSLPFVSAEWDRIRTVTHKGKPHCFHAAPQDTARSFAPTNSRGRLLVQPFDGSIYSRAVSRFMSASPLSKATPCCTPLPQKVGHDWAVTLMIMHSRNGFCNGWQRRSSETASLRGR